MPRPDAPRARSLADDLRARADDELAALLVARPDLARPAPTDITALAARSGTRASTQRALEGLDTAHLQVLEALLATGSPADVGLAASWLGSDPGDLLEILTRLETRALVWRSADRITVTRTVADLLGPRPGGLGPSLSTLRSGVPAALATPEGLDAVLADAPGAARAVLERLTWSGGVVAREATGVAAQALAWLTEHHLLHPHGDDALVLPREVALHLRGGRLLQEVALQPPTVTVTPRSAAVVDLAAGGAAGELLDLVGETAAAWGERPPRVLRGGGLAVRDLRGLATLLDLPVERTALVVEVAHAAGLLADDGAVDPVWAPTPDHDVWLQQPGSTRWAVLADAWLRSARAPHLVGSPLERGGSVNALSADAQWPPIRGLRQDVLAELAQLPEGSAPTVDGLVERLRWRRPLRRVPDLEVVVAAVVREAEWLGVTGRGALGAAGRRLVTGTPPDVDAVAETMHPHLPAPVEQVLLQADLTAVAPGRVEGALAHLLRLAADVESRGGATVHRFTDGSVRRALDAGWTADQLLDALAAASSTPVPQPLTYLVRDVTRRHGRLRVAAAASYVRSEDPVTLEAILASPALGPLRLRRIAPTVLVSPVGGEVLLTTLREHGLAPAAETADGVVAIPAGSAHRTPPRRRPASSTRTSLVDQPYADALVAALRAGQAGVDARAADDPDAEGTDPAVVLGVLREAVADRRAVRLRYAGSNGDTTPLLFHPRRVEAGRVYGTAGTSNVERILTLHRITDVSEA
ncbi:helicase-associated domain-containing protein [Arsenicicoccus sp. oral taxon 190]|uniref:helicase-associated domain-containing protein n=1 Tax=Arsenicicoccus sp. oral taxon 190 TaxID=1658671 RepID=UPI00067A33A0|nr:helicase-associated domain-containing protein [Arsenicicoccus sp. oral taxon 190]AKT50239.1 hypothetical protein ADJ73_00905 [Arsenicicoccus sp. oral taxon 190]